MPPYSTAALVVVLAVAAAATAVSAADYANHTVGGAAGWFFDRSPAANYSAWAADETFNLGDYLIFNTNTNQTVVQTYNSTTYDNCTMDFSSDGDTFIFGSGSAKFGEPQTVAVPLVKVGPNYFFSDADDGAQCLQGMRFGIKVNEGSGLPASLNRPPPPPYAAPPAAEPPPVFQSEGGGQGESLSDGGGRVGCGVGRVVVFGLGILGLGLIV